MSEWKTAMVVILPLMLERRAVTAWTKLISYQKPRAWFAVFLSSLLAVLFPLSPAAYLAIDLFCGGLVIARPAGSAQKAIGLIFTMMALIDCGYIISPQADHGILYYEVMVILGWAQFAILLLWGSYDAWRYCASRFEPHRRPVAIEADIR